MNQLSLFPEEFAPVESPKKKARHTLIDIVDKVNEYNYNDTEKKDLHPRKVGRLRDFGIYGRDADFYTSMRMATNMNIRSIKAIIDALSEYVAVVIAEGRDVKIPGLGIISTKVVSERTTQLADRKHGKIVKRTVKAHKKVKFRPSTDLLRCANAKKMSNEMYCK